MSFLLRYHFTIVSTKKSSLQTSDFDFAFSCIGIEDTNKWLWYSSELKQLLENQGLLLQWYIRFICEPSQLTANQRFRHSDFVTDFVAVISSQREGLGKMALGIVKYFYDSSSQPIGVIWFAVSCRGTVICIIQEQTKALIIPGSFQSCEKLKLSV